VARKGDFGKAGSFATTSKDPALQLIKFCSKLSQYWKYARNQKRGKIEEPLPNKSFTKGEFFLR